MAHNDPDLLPEPPIKGLQNGGLRRLMLNCSLWVLKKMACFVGIEKKRLRSWKYFEVRHKLQNSTHQVFIWISDNKSITMV